MQASSEPANFPDILPAGDSAALIRFGDALNVSVNAAVLKFDRELACERIQGVTETSPALVSLLVRFNPLQVSFDALCQQLEKRLGGTDWFGETEVQQSRRWRIPVLYGDDAGEDLGEIATLLGLSEADTIDQHSASVLRVLTLGFAPGCAYLGMLPENWNLPRLKVIKPRVEAGSILVAVRQTVMPSAAMPTGWRCIGRTPLNNFNTSNNPPVLVQHGDEVQYTPVSKREFEGLQSLQANGETIIECVH